MSRLNGLKLVHGDIISVNVSEFHYWEVAYADGYTVCFTENGIIDLLEEVLVQR